jgi:hypothetical protein
MYGGLGLYMSDAEKARLAKAKGAITGTFQGLRSGFSSGLKDLRTGATGALSSVKNKYGAWQEDRRVNKAVDALEALERKQRRAQLAQVVRSRSVGGRRRLTRYRRSRH